MRPRSSATAFASCTEASLSRLCSHATQPSDPPTASTAAIDAPATSFWFSFAHFEKSVALSRSGSASAAVAMARFAGALVPIRASRFDAAASRPDFFFGFLSFSRRCSSFASSTRAMRSASSSSSIAETRFRIAAGEAASAGASVSSTSAFGSVSTDASTGASAFTEGGTTGSPALAELVSSFGSSGTPGSSRSSGMRRRTL